MRKELLDGFQLREFRIDPLKRSISSTGGDTHLSSKSIEVLLKLAEQPHTLVSRESLLESVWGDIDASSEYLNNAISELRHTFSDDHHDPKFVQTVPRRGYRLLVAPNFGVPEAADPVKSPPFFTNLLRRGVIQAGIAFLVAGWVILQVIEVVGPNLGLPDWTRPFATYVVIGGLPIVLLLAWFFEYAKGRFYLDPGKTAPGFLAGLQRNYVSIFAAYIFAIAGAGIYQAAIGFSVPGVPVAIQTAEEELIPIEPYSIAVLRFMNIDGSEQSEMFSHGLAEDVLDRLARVPGLLVSARGDSWSLPVNSRSTDVRQRLRVAYYLEGSVRIVDDHLRVVAQLIDSERGVHIVSRSFDKKIEDFLEVQREITDLTVASLRVALPEETQMLFASDYDGPAVDAYVMYRRGKELMDQPMMAGVIEEATGYFEQALALDPGYAAAHAGLCAAFTARYATTNDPLFIKSAEQACAAGMAANSNLHMVYTATGDLYAQTGNLSEAESAYLAAVKINAQDVLAMEGLAAIYERQQRLEDAVQLITEAIRLQPGNWRTLNSLGRLYFRNGVYDKAADAYARVVALDPGNSKGLGNLGSSLMMTGDFEGAALALQASLELEPNRTYFSNLAIIYYYLGRFDDSVAILRRAVEESPNQNFVWLNFGDALLFSSESEKAEAAFRRSAEIAEKMLEIDASRTAVMYELAWAKAMLGDLGSARRLIDRSTSIDPDDPYVHYYDALVSVREDRYNNAITALQEAVAGGYPAIMLANEPHLNPLRDLPEFRQLISSLD